MTMVNDVIKKGMVLGLATVGSVTTGALITDLAKKLVRKQESRNSSISDLAKKEYARKELENHIKINDLADRLAEAKYSNNASEKKIKELQEDLESAIRYADYDQKRFEEEWSKELGLTKYSVRTVLKYRQRRDDILQAEIDCLQKKLNDAIIASNGNKKELVALSNLLKRAIVNKAIKMREFDEYWETYLDIHRKADQAFANYNGGEA